MPDGATHYMFYKKGYWISVPLSIGMCALDWKFGLGNIIGYTFHRWCDNDWDIMGTNNAEGRMVNELPILGHVLYGISSTYGSIFRKKHRSIWTHFPYLSTAIRLFFVFIIPFTILDGYGINLIGNNWHLFWLGFWNGLSNADAIHYYLDVKLKD